MSHSLAYRSKQNLQPCMNSISTKTSWPKVTKSFGSCYSALHEKSRTITGSCDFYYRPAGHGRYIISDRHLAYVKFQANKIRTFTHGLA